VIWLLACHRRRLLKEGFLPPILFFSSSLSSTNNNHQQSSTPTTSIKKNHSNITFHRATQSSICSNNHQPPTLINLLLLNILLGTFKERLGQSPSKTQNLPYCLVPACSLPVEPDSRCASHSWHSTCSKLSGMQDSHESFGIENPPTLVGGSLPRKPRASCSSLMQSGSCVCRPFRSRVNSAGCVLQLGRPYITIRLRIVTYRCGSLRGVPAHLLKLCMMQTERDNTPTVVSYSAHFLADRCL
jgi:hypothetical protein